MLLLVDDCKKEQADRSVCREFKCRWHMAELLAEECAVGTAPFHRRLKNLPHMCFHVAIEEVTPTGATYAEIGRLFGISRLRAEQITTGVIETAAPKLMAEFEDIEGDLPVQEGHGTIDAELASMLDRVDATLTEWQAE